MNVELISIGDELLIGQTINTNVTWIGKQLSNLGAQIVSAVTIRDNEQEIIHAINVAMERADLVIITGGLGPTKDDITKITLCKYFDTQLTTNVEVLSEIEKYFKGRNLPMLEVNIQQAEVPEKADILRNNFGTAPGMWFDQNDRVVLSLPGVPYEMKGILQDSGLDRIKERFSLKSLYYRTIQTQGIGESYLADRIEDIENSLSEKGVSLAYLPSPGQVRLRLSSTNTEAQIKSIDDYVSQICSRLTNYVFGFGEETLPEVLGKMLSEKGMSVSTVESCTGGSLSSSFVSVPGSSAYFNGGIISYSSEIKKELVGVDEESINQYGVVSKSVVEQMAINGREALSSDYCISTTGIAGPDGGTKENPVGTVWIGIASSKDVVSKRFQFGSNRNRNIEITVKTALNLLRCILLEINIEKS